MILGVPDRWADALRVAAFVRLFDGSHLNGQPSETRFDGPGRRRRPLRTEKRREPIAPRPHTARRENARRDATVARGKAARTARESSARQSRSRRQRDQAVAAPAHAQEPGACAGHAIPVVTRIERRDRRDGRCCSARADVASRARGPPRVCSVRPRGDARDCVALTRADEPPVEDRGGRKAVNASRKVPSRMLSKVGEHVDQAIPDRARAFQRARVKAIRPEAAAPPEHPIHAPRHADRQALHAT